MKVVTKRNNVICFVRNVMKCTKLQKFFWWIRKNKILLFVTCQFALTLKLVWMLIYLFIFCLLNKLSFFNIFFYLFFPFNLIYSYDNWGKKKIVIVSLRRCTTFGTNLNLRLHYESNVIWTHKLNLFRMQNWYQQCRF